ncbi:Neuron navigator 3, partial [Paramuricea clavata]
AETSQQLDELRVDVNEFKDSFYSGNNSRQQIPQRSRDYDQRLHRLQKLKSFFGEEPPMVSLLLQKMGYERFIPHFKAEEIGILELPYMTEQRLQNLGIPLGPRLRILEEIQNLR